MTTEKVDIKNLEKSVFNTLYEIDTREREAEKDTGKSKLNYLPWATTYSEVCKNFEDVQYVFERNVISVEEVETVTVNETTSIVKTKQYKEELPYFETPIGLEVRTSVTINGVTKKMNLPVYDAAFKSMGLTPYTYSTKYGEKTVEAAKMSDVYKSIMRCFAKNLSMFGVGLHMWTKEDAPESILQMNKLQAKCQELIVKKCALSNATKEKVAEICKEMLPEENGDPKLCTNNELLEALKKKLEAVRKIIDKEDKKENK